MSVLFNNKNVATEQSITPEEDKDVNTIVRLYNKDFVVVSDVEWRSYEKGRIYKIKLSYMFKTACFTITVIPNPDTGLLDR